ncbi:hypothetical protein C1645_861319 [Glomus cerebriforme]|uniref:Protein kinase domain-containing protein n=1 Tax=Glomus cerebriforme TaxID=658196 RepID=A0A397SAX6_9GLOM|nr:hypothetical protein C1645_861319 [Glomus cerebriforme]
MGTDKDIEKAIHWYQKAAENGNKFSQYNLGRCYRYGIGVERDEIKAFEWCKKSAEQECSDAQVILGAFYESGIGIEKDIEKAIYWYQKAAENGNEIAQYNLGKCFQRGIGIEKDEIKAFEWFKKSAEQESSDAQNELGYCYENGMGIEKDIEKAIHWYQKAAENGNKFSQYNLGGCVKNGIGIEKDEIKALEWYKKSAEQEYSTAQVMLGIFYEYGMGVEKDIEKAIYWYQKATENGNKLAQYNLGIYYIKGIGVDKDEIKAFEWYKELAEQEFMYAQAMLGVFYESGIGTEKDIEEAIYWYQKAAERNHGNAQYNLALLYANGENTRKNLEKAFYWHQKSTESNELIFKDFNNNEICKECKQLYVDYHWCQQCNTKRFQRDFSKWTSKNEFIDKFIQEAQLNAKNSYEVLEWIPYNKLKNIEYYDKGGFSEIHKAIWLDGPIDSWNFDKQQWNRWNFQMGYEVVLKNLNNSSSLDDKFLSEWKNHYDCQKKSFSKFIQFFGITQDPNNLNYIMVMNYAKKGSLKKCLSDIVKLKWQDKLQLLKNIITGIKTIHESGLFHGDFHDGNILISDNYNEAYIIDLGLCKPVSDIQDSIDRKYGVLPYMAPEVLRNKPYTLASDIYSFSMIMWEFTSGIPPYNNKAHDYDLVLSICEGERPEITNNTPKCYVDLMKKCWDSDPSKRPTIIILENIISQWISCIDKYYLLNGLNTDLESVTDVGNIDNQLRNDMNEFIKANNVISQEQANSSIIQFHPQEYYTSGSLTPISDQRNSDCLDCIIDD